MLRPLWASIWSTLPLEKTWLKGVEDKEAGSGPVGPLKTSTGNFESILNWTGSQWNEAEEVFSMGSFADVK